MGKKYIVEIGRLERLYKAFVGVHGKPSLTWLSQEVDLTPYTEPDLEQVKCEAYEEGRNSMLIEVQKAGKNKIKLEEDEYYQRGLSDAWEAARKIWEYDTTTLREIFGEGIIRMDWFMKFTASEAIEKLKAYKQGAEIRVGDVVRVKNAPEVEIWVTDISDEDGGLLSGLALKTVDDNCDMGDTYANRNIYNFERTGKHYDVSTVIEKIREGQDG